MTKEDEFQRLKGECIDIASHMMRDFKDAENFAQLLYHIAMYQGGLDLWLKDLLAVMKEEEKTGSIK